MNEQPTALPSSLEVSSLDQLVASYLDALRDAQAEPMVSVFGLLVGYVKFIWVSMNLYVLPFIGLANAVLFVANRFIKKPRTYWRGVVIRYLAATAGLVRAGELPIGTLVTARPVIRLLIAVHIRSRVSKMVLALKENEIRARFAVRKDKTAITELRETMQDLARLNGLLGRSASLKLLSGTAASIATVVSVVKAFRIDEWLKDFVSSSEHDVQIIRIAVALVLITLVYGATGLVGTMMFSFIRKRQLFLARNVYALEHDAFHLLGAPRVREFPTDLVSWYVAIIFSASLMVVFWMQVQGGMHGMGALAADPLLVNEIKMQLGFLGALCSLLLVAGLLAHWRRYRLDRR
jgi:hypothetical protein